MDHWSNNCCHEAEHYLISNTDNVQWHHCHTRTFQKWQPHPSWHLTHNVTLPQHKGPSVLIKVWQAPYWLTSQRQLVSTLQIGFSSQHNDTQYQSNKPHLLTPLIWLMGPGSERSSASVTGLSCLICRALTLTSVSENTRNPFHCQTEKSWA